MLRLKSLLSGKILLAYFEIRPTRGCLDGNRRCSISWSAYTFCVVLKIGAIRYRLYRFIKMVPLFQHFIAFSVSIDSVDMGILPVSCPSALRIYKFICLKLAGPNEFGAP